MLLRSIAKKKIPKNNEVGKEITKMSLKDSSHGTKKKKILLTHTYDRKQSIYSKKKKIDGPFRWKIQENQTLNILWETKSWLLYINKYF